MPNGFACPECKWGSVVLEPAPSLGQRLLDAIASTPTAPDWIDEGIQIPRCTDCRSVILPPGAGRARRRFEAQKRFTAQARLTGADRKALRRLQRRAREYAHSLVRFHAAMCEAVPVRRRPDPVNPASVVQAGPWRVVVDPSGKPVDPFTQVVANFDNIQRALANEILKRMGVK